ncbi:AAA family ATPase [Phaeobacter sp.]|uniref:AAA family ATPase n=1 Tax=Phaeobacter sp. TaxID=1902409 RepID=UPI0025EDE0AF|nr:AAA family ATPase [Phaeobacter sp.]
MAGLVCLSGLPGVGKSSVACALSDMSGAIWLCLDEIETAMRHSHMKTDDLADAGYAAAQVMAQAALRQGHWVISDCVNPIALTRTAWRKPAQSLGARHIDVWLTCSDLAQHKHRVDHRRSTIEGWQPADWASVQQRHFEPFDGADLIIDTAAQSPEHVAAEIFRHIQTT